MASTLPVQPCVKSHASVVKLLAPPPFLLLFLLLLLSLFLALSLLHINDLLSLSLSSPPLFHSLPPLLFDNNQGFLSHLLHFQQHYLAFLLSPCPIFILANLIVFALILSVYFPSSSASSDFSDFVPEKFDYGDATLPEHSLPSHEDLFLASPPHHHFVLSHDPPEEYHVLSFNTNYDESTYYRNVQSYNKLSNNWEKVKGVSISPYIRSNIINGIITPNELKKPADKVMIAEKVQSALTVATPASYKMLHVGQGKVVEKGLQENKLQEKASRSTKAAVYSSPGSQAVVINMEPAPASRRTRILTNTSMQASHPPLAPLAPLQHPAKVAPLPSNTSNIMSAQRPPSSPRVKKISQSTGSSASDGRYEASKTILDGEKQASKPSKPQKKPSNMVRSHSDQRLSERDSSAKVTTVLTSPSSFTNRPYMQRAQSLRSSSTPNTIASVLTNKPHIMQRAQSLRGNGTADTPNSPSHGQVTRSPSFSASLDGLSDSEANKCFSDFIAHRFALMKKELD